MKGSHRNPDGKPVAHGNAKWADEGRRITDHLDSLGNSFRNNFNNSMQAYQQQGYSKDPYYNNIVETVDNMNKMLDAIEVASAFVGLGSNFLEYINGKIVRRGIPGFRPSLETTKAYHRAVNTESMARKVGQGCDIIGGTVDTKQLIDETNNPDSETNFQQLDNTLGLFANLGSAMIPTNTMAGLGIKSLLNLKDIFKNAYNYRKSLKD